MKSKQRNYSKEINYWYNNERFQSKLKNHTPVEYRSVV
ncbi:hypothetical protein AGE29_08975 [Clostridium botulinum]|nr:IS3 family transposase [Clostridium botulinum]AXG91908.1 hypothetical protein AGE29_08975 [Clostridium botulinum]